MSESQTHARLREAIHKLTQPHEEVVEHEGRVRNIRLDPPLLDALRDGVGGNIGAGTGGSKALAHHERAVIDATATELYRHIEKRIRGWARNVDIQPTPRWPDTIHLLPAWHTHVLAWQADALDPYVIRLEGWIREIVDLVIDPPDRWTPTDSNGKFRACPKCGQQWAIVDYGGEQERVPAIKIIERNPLQDSLALCQACGATWRGLETLRELAGLLVTTAIPVIHQEAS